MAAAISAGLPPNRDLWVIESARGTRTRITDHPSTDVGGAWSPDGSQLAFTRSGGNAVFVSPAGGGAERQVASLQFSRSGLRSWSPDGRLLLVNAFRDGGGSGIWTVPASGEGDPEPFAAAPSNEGNADFSPDGQRIAYNSDETGVQEIYVQAFPATKAKVAVSRGGGVDPRWRYDSRELFYLAPDGRLMAVLVNSVNGAFTVGEPVPLFDAGLPRQGGEVYDVARDGQRFLVVTPLGRPPMTVSLNWQALLVQR